MTSTATGFAAAGVALLVAELLSRQRDAPKVFTPGEHLLDTSGDPMAWRPLRNFDYNPCGSTQGPPVGLPAGLFYKGRPAGYDAAWLIQKATLELQFEAVAARYCNSSTCITIPVKTQPRVPPICASAVAAQWADIVRQATSLQLVGAFSTLAFKDCLTLREQLDEANERLAQRVVDAGGVGGIFDQVGDAVRGGGLAGGAEDQVAEIFSIVRRLASRLDAAANLTGDAITEGALQFAKDMVDPENYLNAVAGAAGAVGSVAAKGLANAAGSLLLSDFGALAALGVAGYFVLRRML